MPPRSQALTAYAATCEGLNDSGGVGGLGLGFRGLGGLGLGLRV